MRDFFRSHAFGVIAILLSGLSYAIMAALVKVTWPGRTDIIFPVLFGILLTDAIRKNFSLNFPGIDVDGSTGFMKQKNAMVYVFSILW